MERLTIDEIIEHCNRNSKNYERNVPLDVLQSQPLTNTTKLYWEHKQVSEYLKELKQYRDLEEQGRLLKLPCKVGDVVYAYCGEFGILEYDVDSIVIDKHITYQCSAYSEPIRDCPSECLDEIEPDISDFGKTVFLTKSEAEAKLKELRGGE